MVDVFRGVGVEIQLKNPGAFLIVRETLTRMGIASQEQKILWQSCYILHKRDTRNRNLSRYAIVHFKELYRLDGRQVDITAEDLARRNAITKMLVAWDLVKVVDEEKFALEDHRAYVFVLPFEAKEGWQLKPKYHIGAKKRSPQQRNYA